MHPDAARDTAYLESGILIGEFGCLQASKQVSARPPL